MIEELDLYGVFVPTLGVLMLAAFLVSLPVRSVLSRSGLYRFVWHRPLFDLALYVLMLGLVVALASRFIA